MAAGTTVVGALMFLVAGTLDWPWAWAYLAVVAVVLSAYTWILLTLHPDLAAERSHPPADAKAWDRPLARIVAGIGPLALLLVCALDRRLEIGAQMSFGWHLGGLVMVAAGGAFTAWAVAHNRFFSALVRIQRDRGHTVVDSGPYRIVRHPGYTGSIFHTMGTPLALGSWWSVAIGAAICAVLVIRTALEDATLRNELERYPEYAARVRYRIFPGIW